MIAKKEGILSEAFPQNIPDVMLTYLNEINSGQLKDQFDDRIVQQDAKIIAWECLKGSYFPQIIYKDTALSLLEGDNANARLNHLEKCLHLIQTIGSAQDQVGSISTLR